MVGALGSWEEFYVGGLDEAPPNGGSTGKAVGGFEPKKWCAAGRHDCSKDWAVLAFDSATVKGIVLQGWGKSCVSQFTLSTSKDLSLIHI